MGSKNQTSTATTSPNPYAMNAYDQILGKTLALSNNTFTPYTGELVPGVNQQQTTGINNINANANYAQPYIQQAAGLATQAATPITAGQIQGYESPYTQDVINSTMGLFADQNAQQLQGVKGNAIAQNALGGNREAVAEAETTRQQNLAQAPIIAGLKNTGYQQAVQLALSQQQAQAQGAYSLGNLGVSGQNAALTGANAQVGAGNLQYGVASAADQAAYQQWLNQQAFPYQENQYAAGIATGVGSQLGGTSSSTQPGPSLLSQLIGAGTAGVGAAGKAGMFAARGGRIPGYAMGGSPYGVDGSPYSGGVSYFPTPIPITRGRGAPPPPGFGGGQGGGGLAGGGGGGGFSDLGYGIGAAKNLYNGYNANGTASGDQWVQAGQGEGVYAPIDLPEESSGGRVGFADGGAPIMTAQGLATIPDWYGDAQYVPPYDDFAPPVRSVPTVSYTQGVAPEVDATDINLNGDRLGVGQPYYGDAHQENAVSAFNRDTQGYPGLTGGATPPQNPTFGDNEGLNAIAGATHTPVRGVADLPDDALGFTTRGTDRSAAYDRDYARAPTDDLSYQHPKTDIWGGLIAAGLGMMASRSPFPGVAIGEGGLKGLAEYNAEQAQNIAEAEKKTSFAQQNKRIDLESARLDQAAKNAQDQLNLKTKEMNEGTWYQRQEANKQTKEMNEGTWYQRQEANKPVVVRQDVDEYGIAHPVYGVRKPDGSFVDPTSGQPISATTSSLPPRPTGTQVAAADNFVPEQGDLVGRNPDVLTSHPELANTIKAIADGRANLGSVGYKQRTQLMNLVTQYDPSWNQTVYNARQRQQSDLSTNGNAGKLLMATNQLLPHLKTASDAAMELQNSSYPAENSIANWWATQTGDPRVKKFETVREVAAMDAARLLRGSGQMAEKDIEFWRNNIGSSGSPAQLQVAIGTLADELIGARVDSINQQYRTVMGREPPNFVSKEAQDALSVIKSRKPGAPPANAQKVDAATRYQQLTSGGMSKADAYSTMHKEGY